MVGFYTLQEQFGLSCMCTDWYITVRGTPKVSVVADTFFLSKTEGANLMLSKSN